MANYKRRSRRKDSRYVMPCGCCFGKPPEDRKAPVEDAPCSGASRKKTGRWCKGRVGVPHRVVYKQVGTYGGAAQVAMYRYVCEGCGKQWYSRPKTTKAGPVVDDSRIPAQADQIDHWDMWNIRRRLAGLKCLCTTCCQ